MGTKDTRVDAYIEAAPPFAQPLLKLMRNAIHGGAPRLEETIQWGMPFFLHGGRCGGHALHHQRDASGQALARQVRGSCHALSKSARCVETTGSTATA